MIPITVFTPTYNRKSCLKKCFEALCRQTIKDFIWLIVDDGSTDDTVSLVGEWRKRDNGFEIRYVYKTNGGLFSGYTAAIMNIDSELCVCVDSDDYLTDHAIELILNCWRKQGGNKVAGILGLDCTPEGNIIGDLLPKQETINLIDIAVGKYHFHNGDRKNVVRTDLYKDSITFESIPNEKDLNPHYLHLAISKKYDFLVLNEPLCVINYQPDGMTATVLQQYLRSPKSFRIMRLMDLSLPGNLLYLIKKTIHYVSSCILSGERCISDTPHKILAVLFYPAGLLWTAVLKVLVLWKNRKKESCS